MRAVSRDGVTVLHVVTRSQRRGAEAAALELSQRLAERGYEPRIVALAPSRGGSAIPVSVLGRTTLGLGTLLRLRRHLGQVDVVIAHGSRTLPAVVLASLGRNTIRVYQSIGDPSFWAQRPHRRFRLRTYLRQMSAIVPLTDTASATLHAELGVPTARLHPIPNWRNSDVFTPATETERRRARDELGVGPTVPVVAVVGSLTPEKDVELAIRAASLAPEIRLVIVGEGKDRLRLHQLAQRMIPGNVCFTGPLEDVRPVFRASDMLLLTSRSEGLPGVIIEAGLSGLPTVSTDVGFVSEIVVDDITGRLVQSRRPDEIAGAIRDVLSRRVELGARARSHSYELFRTEVVVQRWVDLIDSLVHASRSPERRAHPD